MKTILHSIDTTGPGGAETVFIELATNLSRDKYHSVIVVRGKGWIYDELCRRGESPIVLESKGSFNWRYLQSLIRLIRRERVDLIQSHLLGSNVYCALAGLITHTPVVASFHGAVDIGIDERLQALKFHALNMGANSIVAVSNNLRENIVRRTALRSNRTTVVYNGINSASFTLPASTALRNRMGWHADDIIIGSLGNIRTAKAYDVLLRAAALLKNRKINFRFIIAGQGQGELYDNLLQMKDELGLANSVFFLGFQDDPAEFLSNLDLFLLSSTSEGFSIATIQAMAAGLPVIVTRSGGPEEIVSHAETGWLVPPGSADAIAHAILKLSADHALRAELALKGRQHAIRTFDRRTMLRAYQTIYENLIRAYS